MITERLPQWQRPIPTSNTYLLMEPRDLNRRRRASSSQLQGKPYFDPVGEDHPNLRSSPFSPSMSGPIGRPIQILTRWRSPSSAMAPICCPEAGLDTYTPGVMRDYFHGTASHDTVVVDGRDQEIGSATAGAFGQKDGITYQSGESSLYPGVTQRRVVMMLDQYHYLITDRITSSQVHQYQQVFHLFHGARITTHGLTVTGTAQNGAASLTIKQIDTAGVTESAVLGQINPPAGLCSVRYQVIESCPGVLYCAALKTVDFHNTPDNREPWPSSSCEPSADW